MTDFKIRQYGRTELAQCYSPALTPEAAWRKLRSWISRDAHLSRALDTLGYDPHSRSFTPLMVAEIVHHLGRP